MLLMAVGENRIEMLSNTPVPAGSQKHGITVFLITESGQRTISVWYCNDDKHSEVDACNECSWEFPL